ncbi:glycosyl hydrolase family 61-domain-containing protein [Mycena floridula]|nr:glycosyl hydrolase family 61-domain-containing protein [Mycena floridula]
MFAQILSVSLLALPSVLAHGGVLSVGIGSTVYPGWSPYNTPTGQTSIMRPWSSYNPILSPTDPTLACNDDGTSSALQLSATVAAGTKITGYWNQIWPHNTGPMLTYMAQCPGTTCTGVNANSLKWFKVDQSGLISGTIGSGTWAAGVMINQNSSWTSTIPATIPAGPYMIRWETIALHSLPAQFYPECAQLIVTGGGNVAPTSAQLVTFPGAYSSSDPGLIVDLYSNQSQTQTNYTIPGPPLYGSTATSPPSGPTTTVGKPTTTVGSGTTTAPSSTSTGAAGTVAQFGQCGGIGYSGATTCVAPYTCKVSNAYYSQCL